MQEEFKFPDEIEAEASQQAEASQEVNDEIKVEIEDDTPPEDRGRKPLPKEVVQELEKDDLEDYSEKVKKRLSQMKKVWHDERREKERALREREEALRFAQAREEEIKQLRQKVTLGQKAYVEEATRAAANDLATVKERLKQAYESGDAEKITEAQEALTDAKMRIKEVELFKPALQKQESGVEKTQQASAPTQQAPAATDAKAEDWRQKNTWFGADEEMTALALGLHEKLVRSGVDPRSDDYYRQIDQTMRKRFPEVFEEDAEPTTEVAPRKEAKPRAQKAANVVAPATRSTAPRQVRLTPTQVAIAKKLGLSNEQYARELMRLETDNG
jgi:hypothetical protein